jgi:hypothetical protein
MSDDRRRFALRENGEETSIFKGKSPRQAALKAARRLPARENKTEAKANPERILLREHGTVKIHIYDAWAWRDSASEDEPEWLGDSVTRANVSKLGIETTAKSEDELDYEQLEPLLTDGPIEVTQERCDRCGHSLNDGVKQVVPVSEVPDQHVIQYKRYHYQCNNCNKEIITEQDNCPSKGGYAIRAFLEEFDSWLSEPVDVYLLGGSAMTVRGLKDQTEDIDLALGFVFEFEHVYQALLAQGFAVVDEPTESFEGVGKTVELHHEDRGFQIDLFERQVVGKVWITDRMYDRAEEFWTGDHATAFILSDEDMFLLKAVSGGDLASGRRRDIEDMRKYAQRGLDYESILTEIDEQRPFNTSSTEARHIRDRSHPLFTIEMAVNSLLGLPNSFTSRISDFATEFEVEYTVLGAVDDGLTDIEKIRDRVLSNVRALSDD